MTKKDLIDRICNFIEDQGTGSFEDLAMEVFRFQHNAIGSLAAYWQSLGATPATIHDYKKIPPVSLAVFKRHFMFAGEAPVKTFRTSGTSGKGRGSSPFDDQDLDLMEVSILANAAARLFKDGRQGRFFMLVPSPEEAPDVIMAYGMRRIAERFGLDAPFYGVRQGKFVVGEAVDMLRRCGAEKTPVTLIGGSFGFVNFVEGLLPDRKKLPLPPGSRLLDAGGFKGRSREIDRKSFLWMMQSFFGLPEEQCFNLYGLTELASQFYSQGQNPKLAAHWTKVRICDPLTLNDVKEGAQGVPVLYDLANVARPFAVLTDDLGVSHGALGFEIIGRASGAAPRGCSLRLEKVR